jgi:endonuclease YncB( thermonuclease family)
MPRMPVPRKPWQHIVLILALAAIAVVRMNRSVPSKPDSRPRSAPESTRVTRDQPPPGGRQWQRLDGCTLVEDRSNDGDSFILRHGGKNYTFRLYFADCPEKSRHQFNGERIAEQGIYFGGLTESATVAAGGEARDFTLGLLRKGPVAVETRWEEVYDSERRYAFVSAGGRDLAEALVARGLARIHTKGVSRPNGPSEREEKSRLSQLESAGRVGPALMRATLNADARS